MALEMKYFMLKPRSKHKGDRHARASRQAMQAYAVEIERLDPELASELRKWVWIEIERDEERERS